MRLSLFIITGFLLTAAAAWAEEPFAMKLSYSAQAQLLQINLERLSRDEVKHVMQRLVIWVNGESRIEENLLNQNHLNQVTKYIPLAVEPEDEIKVVIHYGYGDEAQEFARETIVGSPLTPAELTQPKNVLVGDPPIEKSSLKPPSSARYSPASSEPETFGYEMEGHQNYGKEGFGYEGSVEEYGYGMSENPIYSKQGYGYERDDDKDEQDIRDAYGYDKMGYPSKDPVYGREKY